ncbi:MAG: hypothetical protein OQK82_09355 [Candidatus Pacearchaeota archaeon]|nr:hypothetical protein [Candidatus Pacearchaeota archaeon]
MVIPVTQQEYFCEAAPGAGLAEVVVGILQEFAKDKRCPSYDKLEAYPDSYLAQDLESKEMKSEAFRQLIE